MRKFAISSLAIAVLAASFALAPPTGSSPADAIGTEIIVDNGAATYTGTWTTSFNKPNRYGTDYAYKSKGTGTATATWRPAVTVPGVYGVYYRVPDGYYDRASNAPFTVHDLHGDVTYKVDQTKIPGGVWTLLGNFEFAAGSGGYVQLNDNANGLVVADAIKFGEPGPADYTLRADRPQQVIDGIGVEIQSDSIGSGNQGLPSDHTISVPNDLVASERQRLYTEMLSGFRYLRVAAGLYVRGVSADGKNIVESYPGQMDQLAELVSESGIEGADLEYWSPAPYWKTNNSLIDGSLKTFSDPAQNAAFLDQFATAVVQDIDYLNTHGVPVKMFSLQNEPFASGTGYSSCYYTNQTYYAAFKAVSTKIKAYDPSIIIHGDSGFGQSATKGTGSALILSDPAALANLDAWSWHKNGGTSDDLITDAAALNAGTGGKPVFNSEWEFLDNSTSQRKMIETAQSIMNWMTFENAPTWFWLHALKPTYNKESEGYGLGLWRPSNDNDFTKYPGIAQGHWDYIRTNWNGVAPFVKYMPQESTRLTVDERVVRKDNRIMAWDSPDGKLGIALTNRSAAPYRFSIDLGESVTLNGHRYDVNTTDGAVAAVSGNQLVITVPPYTIDVWTEAS